MSADSPFDAIVIGSGPNGLAAAIRLGHAGRKVLVVEAKNAIGGGLQTQELTLPGFKHDVCATSMPLAAASPFLSSLPLEQHGVRWVHPQYALAHPLDTGPPAVLERDIVATANHFGNAADAARYQRLMQPLVARAPELVRELLAPLHIPRHPFLLARFGRHAIRSGAHLAGTFRSQTARALMAGLAAHAALPITQSPSAAFAITLAVAAHSHGWPFAEGGSARLAEALAEIIREQTGEIVLDRHIHNLDDLPKAHAYLFDTMPAHLAAIARNHLPENSFHSLYRYRQGLGAFKMDWALSEPVPWRDLECREAGVLHLGGTLEAITAAEAEVTAGHHPQYPFLIVAQSSVFDRTRAPSDHHTLWAYCHVPNGSSADMARNIEQQIEHFAPGFQDVILARHAMTPRDLEKHNPNLIGGDVTGGAMNWSQLFTRPTLRIQPYKTPNPKIYICSAATPPGGGVHGMCGVYAAHAVLAHKLQK